MIHSSALKDGDVVLYTAHKYDTSDRILSQTWQIGDDGFSERYIYNQNDGTLDIMVVQEDNFKFGYDALKRLNSRSLVLPGSNDLVTVDYAYKAGPTAGTTTTQIQSITYRVPETTTAIIPKLTYTYDVMGNITKVQPYGKTATTYTYGSQNQPLKETKGNSSDTYTYDTYGNIRTIQKNESGYTSSYTLSYNDSVWLDRLTSVTYKNASGGTTTKDLVYDEVGNPTTYFNGSKTLNMSWRYGRQLSGVVNGSSNYSYTYDVDGIRKSKTVNGTVHDYVTLDGKVVRETWGSTAVIDYFYDNEGKPYKISVEYGNETYTGYYLLNQQGDVIAIIDGDGDVLVEYTYNAWGKQTAYSTSTTAGGRLYTYNALKYRGYYYDSETGFYYLGSRYYDPVIGRFISADTADVLSTSVTSFKNKNLYAYCDNNPINYADQSGELAHLVLGALVGAGVQLIADVSIGLATGKDLNEIVNSLNPVDYISAGISGAIAASGVGAIGAVVANAALGGATYMANCDYNNEKVTVGGLVSSTVIGGISGAIGGAGIKGKQLLGSYNNASKVLLKTKCASKIVRYTAKQKAIANTVKAGIRNTYKAGIFSNVMNYFRKYISNSNA